MKLNWSLIGFLLIVLGFLSFLLTLFGIKFKPLGFIFHLQPILRGIIHILMIFGGAIIVYLTKTKEYDVEND